MKLSDTYILRISLQCPVLLFKRKKHYTVHSITKKWWVMEELPITVAARSNVRTLGSWVQIPLDCVHLFCMCVILCVSSGLATG
jgi:hypothetical protein